jgi:hypothetical protein
MKMERSNKMKRLTTLCTILLIASASTPVQSKSVTFYADGAVVELEATTLKGVVEIPLPSGMIEGSLRVKPSGGTILQRVDIIPAPADSSKTENDLGALLEQKNRLGDRLQALATREEIFKSAAKSQSGKAPRKTKTNPEPMQSIRQGTEFAIAQLEAVYTARRKAEQEIRRIDSRIAAAKNSGRGAESVVRIVCSPIRGKVAVRYALSGHSWVPRYDMYLNGSGNAQVKLSGQFPGTFGGYLLQASLGAWSDSSSAKTFLIQPGPTAELARYKLAVTEELFGAGVISSFSFGLKNAEPVYLPAGDANIYRNGEYVGKVRFSGLSSGRNGMLSLNK